jgi:hypothetical protein
MRLVKWWRKRQKEKKRLELLALVRKVREEQGDYDRGTTARKIGARQKRRTRRVAGQVPDAGRGARKALPSKRD